MSVPKSFWLSSWLAGGLMVLLAACTGPEATPTIWSVTMTPTVTPEPAASPTPLLSAREAAEAYLAAWQKGDYGAMYAGLTPESQAALPAAEFEQQYRAIQMTITVASLTANITDWTETAASAEAKVHIQYTTGALGLLETDMVLPLQRAGTGAWGVGYSPALIWPDLVNGQTLYLLPEVPARGTLYDRNGVALAQDEVEAYALGLVPGEIQDETAVQDGLARLMGVSRQQILDLYQYAVPDQYLPVTQVSAADFDKRFGYLADVAGIKVYPYTGRFYAGFGAAAHVTGYVSYLAPDELADYVARGYSPDQLVGRAGLEQWGEVELAGRNGGSLVLMSAVGQPIRTLVYRPASPGQDLYATVDLKLQRAVQFALGALPGAAVVIQVQTGEVLALASNPTFDANLFSPYNYNGIALNQLFTNAYQPLNNRATQGGAPLGSVFKVVTFSAGLNSGLFTPDSRYDCTGEWEEIPGTVLTDWKEGGHGDITLMQGLAGSCNPYFWHIGYALFNFNPKYLSDTARQFGFGQAAGLEIGDAAGQVPDPDWKKQTKGEVWEPLDSLNLAIGQGDLLVTPLQVSRLMAAIGNGGTLYQPQLILRVQPPEGAPTVELQPKAVGQLTLSPENLLALQTAMHNVTQEPLGTARNRFRYLKIPVAGKTGTAEDPGLYGTQAPDAWFAGYTLANRTDKPDIAIAVMVANQGQGSDVAAPIFRRIVESYFGLNLAVYPWEESVGVVRTPEPTEEAPTGETPTPP